MKINNLIINIYGPIRMHQTRGHIKVWGTDKINSYFYDSQMHLETIQDGGNEMTLPLY